MVLDTGVVVRGLTGSSSSRVVRAVGTGAQTLALSDDFLAEMGPVMGYPRIERRVGSVGRAFEVALDPALMGRLYRTVRFDWPSIPDPNDGWMLDLAFAARADFIVTWDPHLLHHPNPLPAQIVEPSQLVTLAHLP